LAIELSFGKSLEPMIFWLLAAWSDRYNPGD